MYVSNFSTRFDENFVFTLIFEHRPLSSSRWRIRQIFLKMRDKLKANPAVNKAGYQKIYQIAFLILYKNYIPTSDKNEVLQKYNKSKV